MDQQIKNIINDNRSGSLTITAKVLDYYQQCISSAAKKKQAAEDLYHELQQASKIFIKQQPNMVLLRRTGNQLLMFFKRLLKSESEMGDWPAVLTEKVQQIRDEINENVDKIAHMGSKIIAPSNKVMTISNSTLVRRVFEVTAEQKRRFEVFCLKSHPPDEGTNLAEYLPGLQVKTHLVPDAQMAIHMPDINLVLTGADRIFETGFINKAGTLPLCLAARHFNIPVYLVVETAKILMESERAVKMHNAPEDEVYTGKNKELQVMNVYFEKIPLELVHKIICEDGVFETTEFIDWYLKG